MLSEGARAPAFTLPDAFQGETDTYRLGKYTDDGE